MDTRIYIVTHKFIENMEVIDNYKPLLVGAYRCDHTDHNYDYDDSIIDNISRKNANYCELTGLYWMCKNCVEGVLGLVHYRRFFTNKQLSNNSKYYFSSEQIRNILGDYDIIVAQRCFTHTNSNNSDYEEYHNKKDWDILRNVIRENFSDYNDAFENMENSNWFFPFNMIIADHSVIESYGKWLFSVLEIVESKIDITSYDQRQKRVFGFMSERLLSVWILKNEIKYYEAPVIQTDSRMRYRVRRWIEKHTHKKMRIG